MGGNEMKIEVKKLRDDGYDRIVIEAENRDERMMLERWNESPNMIFAILRDEEASTDPYKINLQREHRE